MSLAPPHAVLFDWDNTLVDSWEVIHAALCDTFLAMDHEPWTLDQTKAWVRRSTRESFPQLFAQRAAEASRVFYDSYGAQHLDDIRALPGALETLESLAGSGVYLAVVSSKNGSFVRSEAAHLGLDGYFARMVGAADAPEDKPSPAAIAAALEGSPIEPGEHVWYVGDTDIDVVCARNSGCKSMFIGSTEPLVEEPAEQPDHKFSDLGAFLAFVRDIGNAI